MALLLGILLVLELLDPLPINVADGPEDEDGDTGKREQAQQRQEHGPGDGMLGDGREEGDGASRPPRKAMIAHAATRAAFLMVSSVVALIRTLLPLIGRRGEAQQRVDYIVVGVDLEGLRYAVGARKLGKRHGEPEPLVARDVEGQDPKPRFRLHAGNELDDVRVEPGVPVAARPQRLELSPGAKVRALQQELLGNSFVKLHSRAISFSS